MATSELKKYLMTARRQKIIRLLEEKKGYLPPIIIAYNIDENPSTVKSCLRKMEMLGTVRRVFRGAYVSNVIGGKNE